MPEPLTLNRSMKTVAASPHPAPHTLLYLDGVTVSFDGFKGT